MENQELLKEAEEKVVAEAVAHPYLHPQYSQQLKFAYKSLIYLRLLKNDFSFGQDSPRKAAEKTKKFVRTLASVMEKDQALVMEAYNELLTELYPQPKEAEPTPAAEPEQPTNPEDCDIPTDQILAEIDQEAAGVKKDGE